MCFLNLLHLFLDFISDMFYSVINSQNIGDDMIYLMLLVIMFSFVLVINFIENSENTTLEKVVVTLIWFVLNFSIVYIGVLYVLS